MDQINTADSIKGVFTTKVSKYEDDRGAVFKHIDSNDLMFNGFGESYISMTKPGVVKGWKYHKKIKQNMVCPIGSFEMVIFDPRDESPTKNKIQRIFFGEDEYIRITLPPKVWYSFKNIDSKNSYIINCVTDPHHPDETLTLELQNEEIPFDWNEK